MGYFYEEKMNGDEIYHNMKKALKKISTPIEGFYDSDFSEIEESESFGDIGSKVSDYIKYFSKVSDNIFVIAPDLETDNPISAFIKERALDSKGKFKPLEDCLAPISYLDRMPELKDFISSKCSDIGIDINNAIVMFVNKNKIDETLSISPEFLLHDIGHILFGGGRNVVKEVARIYGEYYSNSNGEAFSYSGNHKKIRSLFKDDTITSIVDWGNHIFSFAMSRRRNYLRAPDVIVATKRENGELVRQEYFRNPDITEKACVSAIESKIRKFCEANMVHAKGKIITNIL